MTTLYDLVGHATAANGGQVLVPAATGGDVSVGAGPIIELAGRLAASDYDSNPEIRVEKHEPGCVVAATPGPRYYIAAAV
ncbi:hypothetical protein [Embleya sp. NPDC005575]|uniref:hypothetical protein n=1 Tax=Embleya sp. NPDC005575 TaxID=3156892 RepID=UPI00339F6E98